MTTSDGRPPAQSSPEATEDETLSLDGGTIYVGQDGPRDAPVLLLIHGSGASTRSWDSLVPLLTEPHRVIRIDLLGHGRSAKPADGDYAIPAQARRVGMALDRLGVTNTIVAGHSSGGVTATALAEQRPDLVTALALINTGPRMEALIAQRFSFEPAQWPHLTDEQIRQAASTGFNRPGYRPPQDLINDMRLMTFHTFTATMRASREYLSEQPVPDRLKDLDLPLLVIFGEDDRRWRSSFAVDYNAVPGAQIEMLPGLGHSPILEDPPRAAAPLLAFTARHAAQP
ncbi:MAG: alpha/beta fold hydrolase [Streptosporangiales bacterium]|nr:alpha/beta fold hydrolase [Streptosporangiales bacterium]